MIRQLFLAAFSVAFCLPGTSDAHESEHSKRVVAELRSAHEVPSVSSLGASGTFKAVIDEDNQTITYELSYEGLEAAPIQAHIHVGQLGANGGVSVFLCGNAPSVPAAPTPTPPACPAPPATIAGVLTPANIVGPAAQGVASAATANEFAELVALIRSGVTYANVHSVKFPGGEIRGQIHGTHTGRDRKDD